MHCLSPARTGACHACLLVLFVSAAPGQEERTVDTSSVLRSVGHAQVTLPPDRAAIWLAIESRAPVASRAVALNARRARRVVAALHAVRHEQDSVLVTGITVGPNHDFSRGTIVDYGSTTTVRVVVRDLDSLSRFLEVAFASGATSVVDVSFLSERADSARGVALARAFARAEADARALADAAGAELGPVLRVSTDSHDEQEFDPGLLYLNAPRRSLAMLTPQDVSVAATTMVTWRIRRRPPR